MSPRRRAQLLLPTPLGTVEYDVLEDAVFVGPAARGGMTADPMPFKEAVVAITRSPEGAWVIRALPGEAEPEVNGMAAGGHALADGDRITLGEHVTAFRTDHRAPPAAGVARAHEPAEAALPTNGDTGRRRARGRRSTTRMRPNPYVTAVTLIGLLILLFGLFLVLEQLGSLRADERVTVVIPAPPSAPVRLAARSDSAQQAYEEAERWQADFPGNFDAVVARFREVLRRHPESPEADRARARIREIVDEAGRQGLARLDEGCTAFVKEGSFDSALKAIRQFERKFGATSSGSQVAPIRRRVREAARRSLDKLLATVGPVVATNPRAAHRRLLLLGPEYPPDLAAEITGLMELAIELMKTQGPPPPERRTPPRPVPAEPGMHPRDAPTPPEEGGDGGDDTILREAEARTEWKRAYEALTARKYQEALEVYTLLSLRYGGTDVFRDNRRAIVNGRHAAKAGAQGPAGLLSVPVEEKRGRITVEYTFDDARVFHRDFSTEQPFPSDRPVSVKVDRGSVLMEQASGIFHTLVWSSDVQIEARVVAEVARDFGVLAVAETDEYRAVMLNVNNTRFTLKKGAAATPNPGHLLWFMGQGVWADADADMIGYIKIAERPKASIENGDRLNLELIRRGDHCEGGFQGRSDGVSLKGQVKGDDGKGMGAARIGLFTNTGAMVVESLTITGKVDEAWFAEHLAELVDLAEGPGE